LEILKTLQSASFDSTAGLCQLFSDHSLSRPADFHEHHLAGVLYFENGCLDSENGAKPAAEKGGVAAVAGGRGAAGGELYSAGSEDQGNGGVRVDFKRRVVAQ